MKKHILLVIMAVLLVGVLLTGCESNKITNESKPDEIGNDNSTVVWKDYSEDLFSLKYPAEWYMYSGEEEDCLADVYFSSEKFPTEDGLSEWSPEVFFGVIVDLSYDEYSTEIDLEEFYKEMEDYIKENEDNDGDTVTDYGKITIDGKPAYRIETLSIPTPSNDLPFEIRVVDIYLYDKYNDYNIYFVSKADKYDANIGIAEEMFKSFKW